ncbi:MAG: Gfo/Idh/MocA family oxidoreductase [Victivallales bacterium]|nr:Gfo/Idh/MocA family oxidoreductase [Victivallales bacterium]MBT7167146.1 Gfo/Idh/MocA family oxidoreductase [Victivallales bacterium]MBT7304107.1 Gfo/Idh/MocA family oxidoreductase [Victivallales bacterium]
MDKLRVGVIGVGSVVREIYQYLYFRSDFTPILDIAAVADPNDEYRTWFCDTFNIPEDRRFADHREMLAKVELDVTQVNTPDHIHAGPSIDSLEAGLDVLVPKPTAATVKDTHRMIETAQRTGQLMGIDFHKREDPRMKEAETRYQSGRYGQFQVGTWYMLDKLMVADPNHDPMFFATPDFAAKNTPISFLTVHMCDALIKIVDLVPVSVRATGYGHTLPNLSPIAVPGYDLCDTEITFQNGAAAHIITGWHLPNTAHATTVQSSRMICSEGLFDLGLDTPGYYEIHEEGLFQVNPLFKNFEKDGTVTGYGISSPGRLYQKFLASRNGALADEVRADMMTPTALGFYTSAVLEAAEQSLELGTPIAEGVTQGTAVSVGSLVVDQLGAEAAAGYGY